MEFRGQKGEVRRVIKSYKDLEVYQLSYKLALSIHKMTQTFPKEETYEISSQMRRAALSIPLNIAEGYGKKSSAKDFKRFLKISLGSTNEMLVLISFVKDLGYITEEEYKEYSERYNMLGGMIYNLEKNWE